MTGRRRAMAALLWTHIFTRTLTAHPPGFCLSIDYPAIAILEPTLRWSAPNASSVSRRTSAR